MEIINEDLAELIGIIIGDGCISRYTPKSRTKPRLDLLITGSWEQDSIYYKEFVQPVMQKIFGCEGRLYHRKDDNTARYWITDRNIVNWFVDIGLPIGSKIDKVKIPDRIVKDTKLAIACIRGIFNTDGCVYRMYSKRYKSQSNFYPDVAVIEIKIKSNVLINQIKVILTNLDIKTNNIRKDKTGAHLIRVTSQQDVGKFITLIKPRKYHVNRYNQIKGSVAQPGRAPEFKWRTS